MSLNKIYGRHAVLEALRAQDSKVQKVLLAKGGHGSVLKELISAAEARGVEVETWERNRFERLAGPVVHQGVLAEVFTRSYADLEDILQAATEDLPRALIMVCDEIEDPRNLGAVARCAEGAGAQGLVITTHRSTEITSVAEKASGGALEHLTVAKVVNLANALEQIKAAGIWIAGLDGETGDSLWDVDLNRPLALVVGNEGKGLRRLTLEKCDMRLKVPMLGQVDSLNASVAAGIALFEIQRQRQYKK
ncbi:MAG: 23S rRNA (guanosine(2251)-2'-O)-methyltransferase RlmB [Candidatus Firestonebacteria bacterium]|nr:23S rRNA (guanosine(2251)-2'-O)-methyltransferase RlmB [Candidatus Firestonebacteria bacterium]